jgi:phospholipid/cholesterol/gamma-HCH transport system permease protein
MGFFNELGRYLVLMSRVFKRPENEKIYLKRIIVEVDHLGLDSLGIVAIISVFMGAVTCLQMAFNIDHPLVPNYTIGYAVRESVVLEFSPTIISLILAGKVGSRIASEIGTMRITEQIDALEIMGINPAAFLIFPKIMASIIINPVLIVVSMFLAVFGGWLAGIVTGLVTSEHYILGIQSYFDAFTILYALIKTVVFAFIISSISSYYGFYTKGGALEVGTASTKGVVNSSIMIIVFNLILTQLLLT